MNYAPVREMLFGSRPASDMVTRVTLKSALLPDIVIDRPLDGGGGTGEPSIIMRILKPELVIESPVLDRPSTRAPWGEPTANYWPLLLAGLALGIVGAVYAVRKL